MKPVKIQLWMGLLSLGFASSGCPAPEEKAPAWSVTPTKGTPADKGEKTEVAETVPAPGTVVIESPALSGVDGAEPVFTQYEPRYRDPVLKEIDQANTAIAEQRTAATEKIRQRQKAKSASDRETARTLQSSLPEDKRPSSIEQFKIIPHLPPVPQYNTGTCWSFAGTSFIESEVLRQTGKRIKLSEMATVYHEYLAKGEGYIAERSASAFAQGSQVNAVFRAVTQFGAVPRSAYAGVMAKDGRHNHEQLIFELRGLLDQAKANDLWNIETTRQLFGAVLDKYLGPRPQTFEFEGAQTDPKRFATEVLNINPEVYVDFMSTLSQPFYQQGEFEVPDNWWHADTYHNVPLNEFYEALKSALENGFSVTVAIDVSEPGKDGANDVKFIAPYDIPGSAIDQLAREYRIVNHSTTDDHAVHLVGVTRFADRDWFLAKDSGRSSRRGKLDGYYMIRDDYIRLKVLAFGVHRDAVKDLLAKFD